MELEKRIIEHNMLRGLARKTQPPAQLASGESVTQGLVPELARQGVQTHRGLVRGWHYHPSVAGACGETVAGARWELSLAEATEQRNWGSDVHVATSPGTGPQRKNPKGWRRHPEGWRRDPSGWKGIPKGKVEPRTKSKNAGAHHAVHLMYSVSLHPPGCFKVGDISPFYR